MCRNTSTSTEYTTINNRCTSSRYSSYRHLRIPFYSAHFTATIDVTIHCTVTNGNFRSFIFIFFCCEICACTSIINTHHGLRAREFVCLTLTASKDILSNCTTGDVHLRVSFYIRQITTAINITSNLGSILNCNRCIIKRLTLITTAIDVFCYRTSIDSEGDSPCHITKVS